ncbi:MAG: hypothetical protein AAFY11_07370, partial [Cyanobacteria bacterium J06641_5]
MTKASKLENGRLRKARSPFGAISRLFSPYWLACIPLAALIVVVWGSSASAQHAFDLDTLDFSDPAVVKGTL